MLTPSKTRTATGSIALVISTTFAAEQAVAGFIDDSHLALETRNFYMNRDFRDNPNTSNSKAEERGQGFMLRYNSGYTATLRRSECRG